MSINIHTMYVDRDTVCQSTYSMSIGIHALMYLDRHTVCQLTYSMSIDIHGVYVDRHTVCRSTYYMSIEILYVDRQLFPTVNNPPVLTPLPRTSLRLIEFESDSDSQVTVTRSDQNCSWCKYHKLVASTSLTTSLCQVSLSGDVRNIELC